MIEAHATLNQRDLSMLAPLVGARWCFVAGETLTHHLFTPVDVIVETTEGGVRIVSDIYEAGFEGDMNTYAKLSVSDDLSGLNTARRHGNVYVHHGGEVVQDIQVVRDTVMEFETGDLTWAYTTDVAIIFRLSGGAIAVAKASHHTEMLTGGMAPSGSLVEVADRVVEWRDDLVSEHRSSRRFLALSQLLEG